MPSEVLHSQEGLLISRAEKSGFCIVRLHYLADPNKRSEQWLKEAKAGVSDAKFRQEFEIEFDAMEGAKAFPEIFQYRDKILTPDIEWPADQKFWAGYDHGVRNPSAFIVFTKDRDGTIYAVWEMVKPCHNLIQFVHELKQCPYWKRIQYIAADPSFKQQRGYTADGNPVSPYEMFVEQGVKNIIFGSRDEQAWLLMVRTFWGNPDDIQFKIAQSCVHLIEEFENAKYPSMNEIMAQQKNFNEKLLDKDNHCLDASKYWMLTQRKLQQRDFKYTTIVNKYRH